MTNTTYKCSICDKSSPQKSHHQTHLKSEAHQKNREIFSLKKLETKTLDELKKEYPSIKIEIKGDFIKAVLESKEMEQKIKNKTTKQEKVPDDINNITNKYSLKEHIHNIHNFLRNKGAGYGMKPLEVFKIFYGLLRLEQYEMLDSFENFPDSCKFSHLYKLAKEGKPDDIYNLIYHSDDCILNYLAGNEQLKYLLFSELPEHISGETYLNLIIQLHDFANVEQNYGIQVSGKVYEYFIGRDNSAISELGAHFTDRPIPKYLNEKLLENPKLVEDKIPTFIDPFGGSGGFTLMYVEIINKLYPTINWNENLHRINHYDMNLDVVKLAHLELMCLSHKIPDGIKNKCTNAFTNEFNNEHFDRVDSNPPYGGDDFNTDSISKENKTIKELKSLLKNKSLNESVEKKYKLQIKLFEIRIKDIKEKHKEQIVSVETSSKRIKEYAKKNNLTGNDKETVSLIQFMDLLAEKGVCSAVLKQGVFFSKNKAYVALRRHLLEHFNVEKIIKITEGSFENTSCVTSLIIFRKDGKTKEIEFGEFKIEDFKKDTFIVNEQGFIELTENEGDLSKVSHDIIRKIPVSKILSHGNVSLDVCSYGVFDIVAKDNALSVNCKELFDLKVNNNQDLENVSEEMKFIKIGSIEENKVIKFQKLVKKRDIKCNNIINLSDILISTCRPKSAKTLLVSENISKNYISDVKKIRSKTPDKYPPIYLYSILYNFVDYFEEMFCQSSMYPTMKIDLLSLMEMPVHSSQDSIKQWTEKLSVAYNLDSNKEYKTLTKKLFNELVNTFTVKNRLINM